MATLMVVLACRHYLWPTGKPPAVGDMEFCTTCRAQREVRTVGRTEW